MQLLAHLRKRHGKAEGEVSKLTQARDVRAQKSDGNKAGECARQFNQNDQR